MSLFSSPLDVIAEAGSLDMAMMDNVAVTATTEHFTEAYNAIPTIDESAITYTEEAVPVFGSDIPGIKAVAELDNIMKFQESAGIEDIVDAIRAIEEHYNLNAGDLGIVVEAIDEEIIYEAKCSAKKGDCKKMNKLGAATNVFDKIKDSGNKVLKKMKRKKK